MIHRGVDLHFYFIRHGQSGANLQPHIFNGGNPPLTGRGAREAKALGKRLAKEKICFDRMFSSPMVRAVQTAQLVAAAVGYDRKKIVQVPALVELCHGDWEFQPHSEILTDEILNRMNGKEKWFVFPGPKGDSELEVQMRITRWIWEEIISNSDYCSSRPCHLAIVGHGVALKCLFQLLMGFNPAYIWKMTLLNASLSHFIFNENGWFAVCLNDAGHLVGIR